MNFNTTLQVDAGLSALGHPSMFQTPKIDMRLNNDTTKISTTDPSEIWKNSQASNMEPTYQVPFDPLDPPLSKEEKMKMIANFQPLFEKAFDNRQASLLFYLFFSKYNCEVLQNNIRYAVNRWSGHHIGEQSMLELNRVMEEVFSKHARHIDEYNGPSKIVLKHLRNEVGRLNELVVNEVVPIIVNALEQHISYIKQVENPLSSESLERPMDTKITGIKSYRSPTDILW